MHRQGIEPDPAKARHRADSQPEMVHGAVGAASCTHISTLIDQVVQHLPITAAGEHEGFRGQTAVVRHGNLRSRGLRSRRRPFYSDTIDTG